MTKRYFSSEVAEWETHRKPFRFQILMKCELRAGVTQAAKFLERQIFAMRNDESGQLVGRGVKQREEEFISIYFTIGIDAMLPKHVLDAVYSRNNCNGSSAVVDRRTHIN